MCLSGLYAGRGESESDVYDDTWALDVENLEWWRVNTNQSMDVPEARFDAAGGVFGNQLWLSMGRSKNKRTLSDTWILNVSISDIDGEAIGKSIPTCFIVWALVMVALLHKFKEKKYMPSLTHSCCVFLAYKYAYAKYVCVCHRYMGEGG